MEFKIDENDDFDEEEIEEYDDDDNNKVEFIEDEEFDPIGVDETDEDDSPDTPAYQDAEPDEDDEPTYLDEHDFDDDSPVFVEPIVVPEFTDQEADNFDYADAIRAYYEDKNYEYAIEQFTKVIKAEKKGKKKELMENNEILAKSLYWQSEAYVKTQDISKAIKGFETLVNTCKEHYLIIAAQRRADSLKTK
ncbi:hypothetical protein JT359_05205 [Candidatus Poribacteria bacterium]|nr:hypothetical protein [Candidatus Poribacteria bacterium]